MLCLFGAATSGHATSLDAASVAIQLAERLLDKDSLRDQALAHLLSLLADKVSASDCDAPPSSLCVLAFWKVAKVAACPWPEMASQLGRIALRFEQAIASPLMQCGFAAL
jgi:hypothetical protein